MAGYIVNVYKFSGTHFIFFQKLTEMFLRPSQPGRRVRLRDIVSSAVRSALGNPELDEEAERFNSEIGATFMTALGTVKKEK